MLSANTVSFNSSSVPGDIRCVEFRPVSDSIVEEDEVLTFVAIARNMRDTFVNGEDSFDVTIIDDEGIRGRGERREGVRGEREECERRERIEERRERERGRE